MHASTRIYSAEDLREIPLTHLEGQNFYLVKRTKRRYRFCLEIFNLFVSIFVRIHMSQIYLWYTIKCGRTCKSRHVSISRHSGNWQRKLGVFVEKPINQFCCEEMFSVHSWSRGWGGWLLMLTWLGPLLLSTCAGQFGHCQMKHHSHLQGMAVEQMPAKLSSQSLVE